MTDLSIRSSTRSKSVMSQLNHIGVSISYWEILRIRTALSNYTVQFCQSGIPIPSHFDPSSFVTAAFDNFDHQVASISGLNGTHDTVAVLFQDFHNSENKKPNISETSVDFNQRSFTKKLPCQDLIQFAKVTGPINLPSNMNVNIENREFTEDVYYKNFNINDFIWILT